MMTPEEMEVVHVACADLLRLLRNMSEALGAASAATRMCAEAAKGIERDLIAIATLVEPSGQLASTSGATTAAVDQFNLTEDQRKRERD